MGAGHREPREAAAAQSISEGSGRTQPLHSSDTAPVLSDCTVHEDFQSFLISMGQGEAVQKSQFNFRISLSFSFSLEFKNFSHYLILLALATMSMVRESS